MTEQDDVPLQQVCHNICIVYNLKRKIASEVEDEQAEYDNISTVESLKKVFEKNGYSVCLVEEDRNIAENLKKENPDIIFNIAEGTRGRSREGQVPALADILGIPYTGSDATTLCISLDKALTKRIVSFYNVKSPDSIIISSQKDIEECNLKFPLIIKPLAEGSSKGISDISIVKNKSELIKVSSDNLSTYCESMMAEEYIDGREFTVGIVGNGFTTHVFTPMEIKFRKPTQDSYCVYSFNVKKDYKKFIEYKCPSDIDELLQNKMKEQALEVYNALECKDFSRVDFRIDRNGEIYFIEINPLPGLAPSYSDFPMLAEFCGMSYEETVIKVLDSALQRLGFKSKEKKVSE